MPVAGDEVVVDHADRLHEGVDDRRPAEFEALRFQILRNSLRQRRLSRNLPPALETINERLAVREVPQIRGKARALFHDLKPGAGRQNGAVDFQLVAHNSLVLHQAGDFLLVVAGDDRRPKLREGAAKVLALAQDGDPGKPGLKAVEHEFLVKRAVVALRHAPLAVVIGHVEGIAAGPEAAAKPVVVQNHVHDFAGSPGNENFAQSGLTGESATPPATSGALAASPSATRSRRSMASPRPPAAEPM